MDNKQAEEALNYMGNVPYWKKTPMTPINQMPDWMVRNPSVYRQK